jgi:mannose-6-phosphate isomerase
MDHRTILLQPHRIRKPWGGYSLHGQFLPIEGEEAIGEAWLFADLSATSLSGAGGEAFHSRFADVYSGSFNLRQAAKDWSGGLLGDGSQREHPLLVKLLDAREHLSVQVHPSPLYAAFAGGSLVKHESWVILRAEPGAVIFAGVREGITAEDVVMLCHAGGAEEALVVRPAVVGECITLPSGIVHALGAGILAAEVQTASDTTYRLYDWTRDYARPERALHLEEARMAMDIALKPTVSSEAAPLARLDGYRVVVADTQAYRIVIGRAGTGESVSVPPGTILVRLEGSGLVDTIPVSTSHAVFARDGATVEGGDQGMRWMEALPGELVPNPPW